MLFPHYVLVMLSIEYTGETSVDKPNIMWGIGGFKLFNLEDDRVWRFAIVEYWNANRKRYLAKGGEHFVAFGPISVTVEHEFGLAELGVLLKENGCFGPLHFRYADYERTAS